MAIDTHLSEEPTSPPSKTSETPHNELTTLITSLEPPLKKVESAVNNLLHKIAEAQVVLREKAGSLVLKAEKILEDAKDTISTDTREILQTKIDTLKETLEKNALAKKILADCEKLTTEIHRVEPYPAKTIPVTEKAVDARREISILQEEIQKIGTILLKIVKLSEQQGFTDTIKSIIPHSFAELLSDWSIGRDVGIQIIRRPKNSPELTMKDWKFLLEELQEKVAKVEKVITQLTDPDTDGAAPITALAKRKALKASVVTPEKPNNSQVESTN